MRRALAGLWVAACGICVAAPVLAQAPPPVVIPYGEEPSISVQASAKTGERVYLVQPGDSLWTIAEDLYDEPWYWPSLWSYNPQITNPHQIYPGDRIYLSRRSAPLVKKKAITFASSRYETKKRTPVVLARRVGYISSRDYRESGKITHSREERGMLGTLDEVYARFRNPRCKEVADRKRKADEAKEKRKSAELFLGPCIRDKDRFVIYRVDREVRHPITNKMLGYRVQFLGEGQAINTTRDLVGMVVTKAFRELQRGDLVTNVFEPLSFVRPKKNGEEIIGTVIDFHHETIAAGQHHYVYLDKGAADGVQRGNRFQLVYRGDGLTGLIGEDPRDFPDEEVGIAMVVEAYDRHSLAVLTHTVREIERGMAAIMAKDF